MPVPLAKPARSVLHFRAVTLCRAALSFALFALGPISCANKAQAVEPQTVLSELVTDPTGQIQVDVSYNPNPPDRIELIVELAGVGIEEMDKVAIDVEVDGFTVIEGSSQWAGFVPPREHRKHRMLLRAAEGAEFGTVTVAMTRFHDSTLLWEDSAAFEFTGGTIVAR